MFLPTILPEVAAVTSTLEDKFGFSNAKKRESEFHTLKLISQLLLSLAMNSNPLRVWVAMQSQNESGSEYEGSCEHSPARLTETNSYMSSEDFITTAASLESTDCTSELLDTHAVQQFTGP